MTALLAALALGLFGSLHCVGMCGPLALALPRGSDARRHLIVGRLLYNLGRVMTYALLGLLFGLLGSAARIAGIQQALSIATGTSILLWLLLPKRITQRAAAISGATGGIATLKGWFAPLFRRRGYTAQFLIGALNGLLPCGFVYIGLAGALAQPGIIQSAAFMALFGAGTFPAMFAVSLAPGFLSPNARLSIRRLLPVGTAIVAVLLIMRGLSLGIPYVSPKLTSSPAAQNTAPACHHH
ncbi:MAG: sulfite exporter TauE/SafE family protein [Blastocatellia bacterium]